MMVETKVINVTVPNEWWKDERGIFVAFKGEVQKFLNPHQAISFAFEQADKQPKPVQVTILYEGEM